MQKNSRVIFIILLLAVYCFAFQGYRGLFEPDEGRYSAVALQMIKSHDWLHPRTHPDHEHWTKPPLTYWAIAGSLLTFGRNEFAVRFPNAFSFFVCIIACFYLGKIFTPQRPWVVSLIFGTFLFPATVCNGATTDYPVTMWETLAVCFFAHAYWGKKDSQQLILTWLMWVFFGLAFLTKGPPGILPLLSIIIFLQLKSSKTRHFNIRWLSGLLVMLVIGGSWYFTVIFQNHGLARYFLWDEVVLRFFTSHHERHSQWYAFLYIYVPVLVFGSVPWSLYTGKGLIQSFKIAKGGAKSDFHEDHRQCLFLMLWAFIPLAVFIASKSNLPLYVLPLFVPLAIITAKEIERFIGLFLTNGIMEDQYNDLCSLEKRPNIDFLNFFSCAKVNNVSLNNVRYHIVLWCIFLVLVRLVMGSLTFRKDSSKFAEAIKEKYPHPVEEIVFVNTRPALGLQFYTGSDINSVSFESSDLKDELKESHTRLWLVTTLDASRFRHTTETLKVNMLELGPIAAWKDYVLFLEISDNI